MAINSRTRLTLAMGSLRDPQDRAARTRVGRNLGCRGAPQLADQLAARRRQLVRAHRQPKRQLVRARFVAHELLDDAILQRMEADRGQASAGIERLYGLR